MNNVPKPLVIVDNTIKNYGNYYDEQRFSTYGNRIVINYELCTKDNILFTVIKHELSHHLMSHLGVPNGEEQVAHFITTVDEYYNKIIDYILEKIDNQL